MAYRARRTGTAEIDRELLALEAELTRLSALTARTVRVVGVRLSAAIDREVSHGLGYLVTGYRVVRANAPGIVHEVVTSKTPTATILLRSSVPMTCSLEFF